MSGSEPGDQVPSLPVSPYLRDLPPYPFAHLDALRAEVEATGKELIDLGMGEPGIPTPAFIEDALVAHLGEGGRYPRAAGLPGLREAAARWVARRYGVHLDPDLDVLPCNGSKEAIFNLPLAVVDPIRRPLVLVPDPAYPVYELGARAAGAQVVRLPLLPEANYLPDLDAVPEKVWKRTALLWINYPNNPTGMGAPLWFLERAAARCREHGVLLASDEAYADIYFGDAPSGALQTGTENVVVLNSLSKRSAMPGYRSGFLAGDVRLMAALRRIRPGLGVATPDFVQHAAAAAWDEDAHCEEIRNVFRRRRDRAVERLRRTGCPLRAPDGTFYLWLPVPEGTDAAGFAARSLTLGVVVLPGPALGERGEGHVRLALTVPDDRLEEALARLAVLYV
jgi:acetylornithine aminotransferase